MKNPKGYQFELNKNKLDLELPVNSMLNKIENTHQPD